SCPDPPLPQELIPTTERITFDVPVTSNERVLVDSDKAPSPVLHSNDVALLIPVTWYTSLRPSHTSVLPLIIPAPDGNTLICTSLTEPFINAVQLPVPVALTVYVPVAVTGANSNELPVPAKVTPVVEPFN